MALGRAVAGRLNEALFGGETTPSLVSDLAIFPGTGTAVLRHSYGIPGVIAEASFFTNPAEERRLRDEGHNQREAQALARQGRPEEAERERRRSVEHYASGAGLAR